MPESLLPPLIEINALECLADTCRKVEVRLKYLSRTQVSVLKFESVDHRINRREQERTSYWPPVLGSVGMSYVLTRTSEVHFSGEALCPELLMLTCGHPVIDCALKPGRGSSPHPVRGYHGGHSNFEYICRRCQATACGPISKKLMH